MASHPGTWRTHTSVSDWELREWLDLLTSSVSIWLTLSATKLFISGCTCGCFGILYCKFQLAKMYLSLQGTSGRCCSHYARRLLARSSTSRIAGRSMFSNLSLHRVSDCAMPSIGAFASRMNRDVYMTGSLWFFIGFDPPPSGTYKCIQIAIYPVSCCLWTITWQFVGTLCFKGWEAAVAQKHVLDCLLLIGVLALEGRTGDWEQGRQQRWRMNY